MRTEEIVEGQKIICNDCLEEMKSMPSESIDVFVTSPPYAINKEYNSYKDNLPLDQYFEWMRQVFYQISRLLKHSGSFFLNVGGNCKQPWTPVELGLLASDFFVLQNHIIWVKSISVGDKNYGHVRPMHGDRFLNQQHESIYHFTKNGDLKVDKLAIGVPYTHKWNLSRRVKQKDNIRDRGNVWFCPYETTHERKKHGAAFPVKLPEQCVLLHGFKSDLAVLDPFLGSGTTLLACKKLGVNGIGIDIDEYYCKLTKDNLRFKPNSISIDGQIYETLNAASKATGISTQTINNRLRNPNFLEYKII